MAPAPPPAAKAAPPPGPDKNLLLQMRRATRRAHNIANALILSKLVVVLTDRRLYALALGAFLPVYAQLERLQDKHAHEPGLSLVIDAVRAIPSRAAAMQQDLAHLLGDGWRDRLPPSPAAAAYAAHLQHLSDTQPLLLLPYVFSMHVPILLGFLGARIQKALQLPDARGVAFFTVDNKAETLARLRSAVVAAGAAIDASCRSPGDQQQQRQRLVQEAVLQFQHNNAVVAGFRLGWRPVVAAAVRAVAAVPAYAWLLLLAVALGGAWSSWSAAR